MEIEISITPEIINESLPLHYRHAPFRQKFLPYLYLSILLLTGLFQSPTSKEQGWWRWMNLIDDISHFETLVRNHMHEVKED